MSDRFELPAELTIYHAAQIREDLLAWMERVGGDEGAEIKVSAGGVQSIDGAGLQLLVALGQAHPSWRLVDTGEAFSEACRVLGLEHWLQSVYQEEEVSP